MVAMRQVENRRWERLKAIDAYATGDGCRRAALLGYFGEEPEPRPAERCCDGHGGAGRRRDAGRPATPAMGTVDAVLLARRRDARQRRPHPARADPARVAAPRPLVAAGHDRLRSHGALVRQSQTQVMSAIDGLIAPGVLEQTGGPYPLVRRAAAQPARTSREADVRSQVLALGTGPRPGRHPVPGAGAGRRGRAPRSASWRRSALGRIGDDAAKEALTAALDDESPDVRNAADAALRHISHVS